MYQVRIKGARVEVSRHDGEPDYSAEIERAFERFQQGAVKDYRIQYRMWPGMNHVGARILDLVARLYGDTFSALADYCHQHAGFADPVISQFHRELQFYLAYLDHISPLRSAGLSFCYPDLAADSKEIFALDTFDLALAAKLTAVGKPVVINQPRGQPGRQRGRTVRRPCVQLLHRAPRRARVLRQLPQPARPAHRPWPAGGIPGAIGVQPPGILLRGPARCRPGAACRPCRG
jgi:hypothetical protein